MVRVGFIGSGNIARHHAKYLSRLADQVEIAANVDLARKSATEFKKEFHTKYADTDVKRLLKDDSIDGVYVCVPTFLHKMMAVKAAKAGKHVFLEKPMAMTLKDADAIIDAVDKSGVKLLMGFVRRYDNHWGKIRELVKSGVVGSPAIWRASHFSAGPSRDWFCQKGGGPLMDGAVHNYDYLLTMFGKPVSVYASVLNWRDNMKGPDTGSALIRFQKGNEFNVAWSWGSKTRSQYDFDEIIGPDGNIAFFADPQLFPAEVKKKGWHAVKLTTKDKTEFPAFPKNDMFLEQTQHFIEVLQGTKKPVVDAVEGRKSLRIACAVFESAKKKQVVRL